MHSNRNAKKTLRTYQDLLSDGLDNNYLRLSKPTKGLRTGDIVRLEKRQGNIVSVSLVRSSEDIQKHKLTTKTPKNFGLIKKTTTSVFKKVHSSLNLEHCIIDQLLNDCLKDIYSLLKDEEKEDSVYVVGETVSADSNKFKMVRGGYLMHPVTVSENSPDQVVVGLILLSQHDMGKNTTFGTQRPSGVVVQDNKSTTNEVFLGIPTVDPSGNEICIVNCNSNNVMNSTVENSTVVNSIENITDVPVVVENSTVVNSNENITDVPVVVENSIVNSSTVNSANNVPVTIENSTVNSSTVNSADVPVTFENLTVNSLIENTINVPTAVEFTEYHNNISNSEFVEKATSNLDQVETKPIAFNSVITGVTEKGRRLVVSNKYVNPTFV